MIEISENVVFKPSKNFIIIFILMMLVSKIVFGQKAPEIGSIIEPKSSSIETLYTYDPESNLYILTEEIGGYTISTPMVMTVAEYESFILKEQMSRYFKEKIQALSGYGSDIEDAQKNLLPELYVNNEFFESIFGSNTIDIKPQGSIGVDLGYRYQRSDNPIASVINRRSPGFDFDQRISLSLLGNIGERLQITANYDTESTFDFQNLVKIEFNPPKLSELTEIIPGKLGSNISTINETVNDISQTCLLYTSPSPRDRG